VLSDKTTLKPHPLSAAVHKLSDYAQLIKLRLSLVVVFSAGITYLIIAGDGARSGPFMALIFGGLLTSGSANTINELIERHTDALMTRTAKRPLPCGRMAPLEAIIFAILTGSAGVFLLGYYLNFLAGAIGLAALLLYGFIYTPLKRVTPFAVHVGALPGALPVIIGGVGAAESMTPAIWALFGLQFFWQFPHFWAIAWLADADYRKAGFALLPSSQGPGATSAWHIIAYSVLLVPAAFLPWYVGLSGWLSTVIAAGFGIAFVALAIKLLRKQDRKSALAIMFLSFAYLPAVFVSILFDKV